MDVTDTTTTIAYNLKNKDFNNDKTPCKRKQAGNVSANVWRTDATDKSQYRI